MWKRTIKVNRLDKGSIESWSDNEYEFKVKEDDYMYVRKVKVKQNEKTTD